MRVIEQKECGSGKLEVGSPNAEGGWRRWGKAAEKPGGWTVEGLRRREGQEHDAWS